MALELTSDAFSEDDPIPRRYTCDGEDVSPSLSIRGVPDEAESLALIVDDPDAPGTTWVHWVLYGLAADRTELPEGVPSRPEVLGDARHGENDFGDLGYGGPCPPPGDEAHRYFFKLYALTGTPGLEAGASKAELRSEIEAMVVQEARLMGRYERE